MKKPLLFFIINLGWLSLCAQQTDEVERIELKAEVKRNQPVHTEVISLESEAASTAEDPFHNYEEANRRAYRSSSPNGTYQGITEGKASVSLSGGFSYEVPIAVPPGVKGAVPNLSLSYNGQGGSGVAGYGWNISGLSTIARIPSDLYHNGFIAGVSLGSEDALSLDGQRLIPVDGTSQEYQTENFSNIKVLKYYGDFRVYYPDGSWAEYDDFSRWPVLECPIKSWKDKQGNEIQYEYAFSDRTARISKIKYGGGKGKELFNEIRFIYKTRSKPILSYVNGYSFKRTHVLSEVQVYANGHMLRKYHLEHDVTEAGQQQVRSITEYNDSWESKPPIRFYYKHSENTASVHSFNPLPIYGPEGYYHNIRFLSGDFDEDGTLDFIGYNKENKDKLCVFTEGGHSQSQIRLGSLSNFKAIFTSKTLDEKGRLSLGDGLTLVKESIKDDQPYSQVNFYSSQRVSIFSRGVIAFLKSKTIDFPSVVYEEGDKYCVGSEPELTEDPRKSMVKYVRKTNIMPKEFVSGDFNGDGITDVLAIEEGHSHTRSWLIKSSSYRYSRPFSEPSYPPYETGFDGCSSHTSYISGGSVYWADLNTKNSMTSAEQVGYIPSFDKYKMTFQTGDYNGDGKTDLFVIQNGKVAVYGLDKDNRLKKIAEKSDSWIKKDKYIDLADFNGDGKVDLLVPEKEGSSRWELLISDGDDYFITKIISITSYQKRDSRFDYRYLVSDFNRDGKSDLLKIAIPKYIRTLYLGSSMDLYTFNGLDSYTSFTHHQTIHLGDISPYSPMLGSDIDMNTRNPEIGFYTPTNIRTKGSAPVVKYVSFNKDFREDATLDYVYNAGNGKKLQINYSDTSDEEPESYDMGYFQAYDNTAYPYINISTMRNFRLVRQLVEEVNGTPYRWQDFEYYGAVSHARGLGFLGFRGRAQTNWHDGGSARALWTVSLHNPELRGAVTYTYVIDDYPYFGRYDWGKTDNIPEDVISKTHYEYTTQAPTAGKPGVFINFPSKVTTTDKLTGVTTTKNFAYNSYWNPTSVVTDYNGAGTAEDRYEYLNNPSGTDDYYMARVKKEQSISRAYGSTFESSTEYTYDESGNAVQIVKKGNGDEESLTEQLTYDSYGNITRRSLSGTGAKARVETFGYDATGRFVTEKTEVQGQVTGYENDPDTGLLLSETDHLGRRTAYAYDGWNRPLTITDYLSHTKRFDYGYNGEDSGGFIVKEYNPEAENKQTYYDRHGRAYKTKVLSLNSQWITKEVKYDASDRKYQQSEPYIAGGASQWTRTEYDRYGRIQKVTAPTGRIMTTSYNGLSVSVDDGVQTKTTVKDALGNLVSQSDAGGAITYTYYANGNQKTSSYAGNVIRVEQDGWGRKTKLTDPSAGEYRYEYNIFGQVLKEITPKGKTERGYDDTGRLIRSTLTEGDKTYTTTYTYDTTTQLLTRTDSQTDDKNSMAYHYDEYGRPVQVIEDNTRASYTTELAYDEYGRKASETRKTEIKGKDTATELSRSTVIEPGRSTVIEPGRNTVIEPGRSTVIEPGRNTVIEPGRNTVTELSRSIVFENHWAYEYERGSGLLRQITDGQGKALYKVESLNARGQLLQASLGNGIKVENTYDAYGYLTKQREASLNEAAMDYEYEFDKIKGNLLSRKNYALTNHYAENFTYDRLDRLTKIENTEATSSMGYDAQGRITSSSEVGTYHYNSAQGASMFQVREVELNEKGKERFAGRAHQEAVFTAFKKPRTIQEAGSGEVSFEYNGGLTRSFAEIRGAEQGEEGQEMQEVAYKIRAVGMSYDKETGTVTKTAPFGWYNNGFSVEKTFTGDFKISWVIDQTDGEVMVGISFRDRITIPALSYSLVGYPGGHLSANAGGMRKEYLGLYQAGDTLSLERKGDSISYYRNGIKLYTLPRKINADLVLNGAIRVQGNSISDLKVMAEHVSSIWKESSYSLVKKIGLDYDKTTGTVTKTAPFGWFNNGFLVDKKLKGDFKVSWVIDQVDQEITVGVSTRDRGTHVDYSYALVGYPGGHLSANAGGMRREYLRRYKAGDTLSLERKGDAISYYRNGLKLYTSPRKITADLVLNGAIRGQGNSISHLKLYSPIVPEHRIKLYNADQSTEVVEDINTGETKVIQYMGSPYKARIAYIAVYNRKGELTQQGVYYLHRDYLGSIVGISDSGGKVIEKRHYGAWGALEKYESNDSSLTQEHPLLDRGWTGHEYFAVVHLVHMNGRMYDTDLRRFLSPDNYVQDPTNTQNYNRYQYGYNNPLKYSDPNGEFLGIIGGLIAGWLLFTESGYEVQKYLFPVAVHIDLRLGTHQKALGFDISVGVPKALMVSYRYNYGKTYFWKTFGGHSGWETRTGGEWTLLGILSYSGTTFSGAGYPKQTTHVVTLGGPFVNLKYENDTYLGRLKLPGVPKGDPNSDGYRTAAARIKIGLFKMGMILHTGYSPDPKGLKKHIDTDGDGIKDTWIMGEGDIDNPRQSHGILYVGFGSLRIGRDSEKIRHFFQNKIAHDGFNGGHRGSKYPWVMPFWNRHPRWYFQWGWGIGSTLY